MSVEELNSAIRSEENLQSLNEELSSVTEYQHNVAVGHGNASKDIQSVERDICAFCAIQRAEVSGHTSVWYTLLVAESEIQYSRRRLRDDFRNNLEEYAGATI